MDSPDRATAAAETSRAWRKKWPDSNIGIATGSGNHIIVLDIDPASGGDEGLVALEDGRGKLPATVEVVTGGGGRHLSFAYGGDDIGNSAGLLGPGLDVRGEGGFVVAPTSVHISGRRYEWEASSHIFDVPIADLPSDLASMLRAPRKRSRPNHPGWVSADLKGVLKGRRNHIAAKLAGF